MNRCAGVYPAGHKTAALKPDLFAVTTGGEYADNWFIEIDLATESYTAILEKCGRYLCYFNTGTEQRQIGGFPCVVWIVPDAKRRIVAGERIEEEYAKGPKLFVVITPEELEPLMVCGAAEYLQNREGGRQT